METTEIAFKKLGFNSEESNRVVDQLNELLCNLHVHYQKLRNYHWNVTGPDFFDIHEQFEQEYEEVKLEIDEIAERIRVFGKTPISTMREYLAHSEIRETGTDLSSHDMVSEIIKDFEILLTHMMDITEVAQEIGDLSTDDMIKGFMHRKEKRHWMLSSFNKKEK
jgi:starvation-inducible DNA-binding protein